MRRAGLVVLACLVTGCTTVHSVVPIGDSPVAIDPAEWMGTWNHQEGTLEVDVVDAPTGRLRATWIEEDRRNTIDVRLLGSGDWMIANFPDPERTELYLWGRLKKSGDEALFWLPSAEKIAALVRSGELPGTVDDEGNVILQAMSTAQLEVITSEARGVLLDWEDPLVLTRRAR